MDPTPFEIIRKPNDGNENEDVNSSDGFKFVPHDVHMAKVLELLVVDLDSIDDKAMKKKGRAKVDRNWISKFASVAWSNAFTEEGHLRHTHIMNMLPELVTRTDAHSSLWISYRRLECAALGLAHYNKRNEADEYYLVKPINANPSLCQGNYVSHANFLAKRKNDSESPVELFFAEVYYHCDEITVCCRLETRLLPPDIIPPLETAKFKRANVIHPEGFECHTCKAKYRRCL